LTKNFRLDNKISLVTGGSKGIGFGIAKALAEAGSDVALLARNKDDLERARDALTQTGRRIWTVSFDMSEVEKIDDMFDRIIKETGGVDVLVNNAGGTRRGPAETLTLEDWKFVINLNMTAAFALCLAFAKERIKSGKKGKIINTASVFSQTVREDNAPYAASKGGIRQMTKALAVDWAKYDINVNAIGPGFIQTDLTRPLWENEDFNKWLEWKTPRGKWGNPEDLGNAAVYLASPASDYVTGHVLYVDGGLLATFGPSSPW
jgi:NAD(P)-dependent dehydrogenase (short-subunit alcohol dehydrogenase family)